MLGELTVGLECCTEKNYMIELLNIKTNRRSSSSLLIFADTVDFAEYFPLPLNAA